MKKFQNDDNGMKYTKAESDVNLELKKLNTSVKDNKTNQQSSPDIPEKTLPSFLQKLNSYLKRNYPEGDGFAFSLTAGNQFPKDREWLVQTPDIWGMDVKNVKFGEKGKTVVNHLSALVASAKNRVDITTLAKFPDGDFLEGLKKGLVHLAKNTKGPVTVRILAGYPPMLNFREKQSTYLESIIEPLKKMKDANLSIYVAAQRTGISNITWNHSKIVAVDGQRVLLGGQNLWTDDYLRGAPVHDLNIQLEGPAVFDMHRFINHIWKEVCGYSLGWKAAYWQSGWNKVSTKCLKNINGGRKRPTGKGTLKVLGVGRYGRLKSGKINPSDDAFVWALDQATNRICLAQQDLMGETGIDKWDDGIKAICRAIERNCEVYIVISNSGAESGSGNPYSNPPYPKHNLRNSQHVTYTTISDVYYGDASVVHPHEGPFLKDYLHIAPLRFGTSDKWKSGKKFANHSKFIMVDDKAFYIGSSNFYPSDLIEYGVFIEDQDAVKQVAERYWDKLWKYSCRNEYHPKLGDSESRKDPYTGKR